MAKYEAIARAVANGQEAGESEITTERVENALYKKALGYNVKVMEPMRVKKRVKDKQTGKWEDREVIEMVARERHVPPDMRAVQFWLTNREKLRWQKSPEQDEDDEAVTVIIDV